LRHEKKKKHLKTFGQGMRDRNLTKKVQGKNLSKRGRTENLVTLIMDKGGTNGRVGGEVRVKRIMKQSGGVSAKRRQKRPRSVNGTPKKTFP